VIDGLLAATALQHDLSLVTRNTRDFEGLGFEGLSLRLINPWQAGPLGKACQGLQKFRRSERRRPPG